MELEHHRDVVVANRKSIEGIGYEEHLYDYDGNGAPARHLQLRDLETLRFIETQHTRCLTGELEDELTDEERDIHAWIASDPDAAHRCPCYDQPESMSNGMNASSSRPRSPIKK